LPYAYAQKVDVRPDLVIGAEGYRLVVAALPRSGEFEDSGRVVLVADANHERVVAARGSALPMAQCPFDADAGVPLRILEFDGGRALHQFFGRQLDRERQLLFELEDRFGGLAALADPGTAG
jgi:hypothetical protein